MPRYNIRAKTARLAVILAGVLIQTSVLVIILPKEQVPNIVLLIIVTWTIIVGFDKIWLWAIIAGIILDLFSFEPLGKNVILLVVASYAVNFFSNRFPMENRAGGIIIMLFIVISATVLDNFFNIFFTSLGGIALKEQLFFSTKNITVQIIISAILFYALHIFLKRMENHLNLFKSQSRLGKL